MMFILLTLSCWLVVATEAGIWSYHGSAPATGAIYAKYGPAYEIESPGLKVSHGYSSAGASTYSSLSSHPIVVPDLPARAVIGPSEAPVLIQGPRAGSATVVGPSEGPALVQGPRQGPATIVGPSEGPATIIGPSSGGATIIGPSSGAATVIGPSSSGATIIGPSDGPAKVIGPSVGGAAIIGPSEGPAKIIGPSSGGATIIGPSVGPTKIIGPSSGGASIIGPSVSPAIISGPAVYEDSGAHAHAEAHAHAQANAHSHNLVIQQPVYYKEIIPATTVVHQHDGHDHRVVCDPVPGKISTSAAVDAITRVGSRYGPVHVSSVLGRPVVTLSGPSSIAIGRPVGLYSPPPPPIAYIAALPSGSISSSSNSASASASASSSASSDSYYIGKKFWYPGATWINC